MATVASRLRKAIPSLKNPEPGTDPPGSTFFGVGNYKFKLVPTAGGFTFVIVKVGLTWWEAEATDYFGLTVVTDTGLAARLPSTDVLKYHRITGLTKSGYRKLCEELFEIGEKAEQTIPGSVFHKPF